MKSLSVLLTAAATLASFAAKADITCTEASALPNQGSEANVSQNQANILLNGQVVATLMFDRATPAPAGDTPSTRVYQQNAANGFVLEIQTGGFTALTQALILRGGVYGYTPQAQLPVCR